MQSSDDKKAREEETIGEPAGSDYASRKGRLTPRQMWARQARRRAKARKAEAAADQEPIEADADEEPIEAEVIAEADEEEKHTAFLIEEAEQDEEVSCEAPILEEVEDDSEDETAADEEEDGKPEPVMVEPAMQPGAMNYPYATHRLAPETPEDEDEPERVEKRISTGFIIGVVVIVFALILGISMMGQRHKISDLEDRVRALEDITPSSSATVVMGGR